MMQTASKLLALAAGQHLGGAAQRKAAGQQRGCDRGPHMGSNLLVLGAGLVQASVSVPRSSAAIVLDSIPLPPFQACLEGIGARMCLPETSLRLVDELCKDLRIELVFNGKDIALAVDPLVRAYGANMALSGTRLCRFADDMAMVLWLLLQQLPELHAMLLRWRGASGMRLQERKRVFQQPNDDLESVRVVLRRLGRLLEASGHS